MTVVSSAPDLVTEATDENARERDTIFESWGADQYLDGRAFSTTDSVFVDAQHQREPLSSDRVDEILNYFAFLRESVSA